MIQAYRWVDIEDIDMRTQARDNFNTIKENDKVEELERLAEEWYTGLGNLIDEDALEEGLYSEWEEIFKELGIKEDEEGDEDEEE